MAKTLANSQPLGYRSPTLNPSGSVVIDGLEHTGDGIRLRLHEAAGRATETRIVGLLPGSEVIEHTIVGVIVRFHRVDDAGEVVLPFRQFEVKTLDTRLERRH